MVYKDSEEYRRKHAEWAKAAYHRNKDKHKARMKKYRESEQGEKEKTRVCSEEQG